MLIKNNNLKNNIRVLGKSCRTVQAPTQPRRSERARLSHPEKFKFLGRVFSLLLEITC